MLRRLTAALLPLVGLATACRTLAPVREAPAAFITAHRPGTLWITKTDNSVVELASPTLIGDTLGGFVGREYVEMPLSNVQSLRARRAAPGRTWLLVGGLTLGGALALYIVKQGATATSVPCFTPVGDVCPTQ